MFFAKRSKKKGYEYDQSNRTQNSRNTRFGFQNDAGKKSRHCCKNGCGKIAAFGAAAALIALAGKYVLSLFGKNSAPVIPNLNEIVNGLDCEQVSREDFMKGAKAGTAGNLENTVRAKIADGHKVGTITNLENQCRQISLSRKSSAPVIPHMKEVANSISKENACSGEDFLEAAKNGHAVKTYNIED